MMNDELRAPDIPHSAFRIPHLSLIIHHFSFPFHQLLNRAEGVGGIARPVGM
jgi:hypothetical protein